MEINRALDQIAEIHGHLSRTELYRGFRSVPVAFTGVLALLGAGAYPWVGAGDHAEGFVFYWCALALAAFVLMVCEIAADWRLRATARGRRIALRVIGQFLPCLGAGALLAGLLTFRLPEHAALLPGLWSLILGLGVFSARPHLPRSIGWCGLFYLTASAALLTLPVNFTQAAFGMGLVFGPGQIFTALVLYWNLERREDIHPL